MPKPKPSDDAGFDGPAFSARDVREMVLRLAHEIRNPLATIKSSVQLIRRLQLSAECALPHLESALKHITRIHVTMQEIERFVSLQAGDSAAVRVEEAVNDVFAGLRGRAEAAGINLEYAGKEDLRVAVEPKQLRLALSKLLENAVSFSAQGERVWVIGETAENGMVHIHVDDEGTGVPEEHAKNIMRPFFSTLTQGIGLGLNVVQRICEIAGGHLEWRNRSDWGCRFTMVLPETDDGTVPDHRG